MGTGGTDTRHVSFAGVFAVAQRQSELKISAANAGLPTAGRRKTCKVHVR